MPYLSAFGRLAWYERGLLSLFYIMTVLGAVSFLAFDLVILPKVLEIVDVENLLFFAFIVALQLIWVFVFYSIHKHEGIVKVAAVALLPMLLTSLPLGLLVFVELTKERPAPVAPVY